MKNTSNNNSGEEDVKSFVRSRVRKGQVQVVKFSLASSSSRHDKQPQQQQVVLVDDEFASNSTRYQIGDMVWGKVKSHPWWPGHIYNHLFASPEVRKTGIEGQVLVAFFGDSSYSSYGWLRPVEEAVGEATRRSALPFACRCRNQDEIGTVYSADQIRNARDNFKPREMVTFLNQLAASPTGDEDRGIEYLKNKAAVIAYRKAVYQEVDETYAHAFGHLPEARTSVRKALGHSPKVPIRAPLSGPLVIAEALGKGKGFAKLKKGKVQAKKDQFLFKRSNEANEFKSSVQINPNPVTSSEQPVYTEGSSAKVKDDCVLQKRSPSVQSTWFKKNRSRLRLELRVMSLMRVKCLPVRESSWRTSL